MKNKLLKTEEDYKEAISRLEKIGDNPNFEDNEDLINEFETIETLISIYEKENFSINQGDPIEIIKLKMKYMGLGQKDLISHIGSKGVVSDVLNKKRGLSKAMIRNLSEFLDLNQNILNVEYDLTGKKHQTECQNPESKKVSEYPNIFGFNDALLASVKLFTLQTRQTGMLINVGN